MKGNVKLFTFMQSLINLQQLSGTKGLSVLKIDIEVNDNFSYFFSSFFLTKALNCI